MIANSSPRLDLQVDASLAPLIGPHKRQQKQKESQPDARSQTLSDTATSQREASTMTVSRQATGSMPRLIEKSVIIHKDEHGFGLRIKGQAPVHIEHVHEGGAAWRAGVRALDSISKVNGIPVSQMDHKDVVLMFKSCSRFVALTLISPERGALVASSELAATNPTISSLTSVLGQHQCQYSIYTHLGPVSQGRATGPAQGATNDSLSLFAPNNFAIDPLAASSLLMDRTRSCRSTAPRSKPSRRIPSDDYDDDQENVLKECDEKGRPICVGCQQWAPGDHQRQPRPDCAACKLKIAKRPQQNFASSDESNMSGADRSSSALVKPRAQQLAQSTSSSSLPGSRSASESQAAREQQFPPAPPQKPRAVNKRVEIIRELIDTERTHTERLRCLDELFYRPLKQAGDVTSEQLRAVFSCHRTLYKIHRQIYRILLSANYDIYSEPLIGSALLEIFDGDLKRRLERAASCFCSAQATNVELLSKLTRRDTKVGEFIAQVTSQRMVGRLGIKDLLASCFQRLTKYPLLLENLLKATPQVAAHELDDGHDYHRAEAGRLNGRTKRELIERPLGSPQVRGVKLCGRLTKQSNSSGQYEVSDDDDDADAGDNDGERDDNENDYELATSGGHRHSEDEEACRNSRRMLAISLAEEREFIERALEQSRQILVRVNESIRVAISRLRLKEIWRRTDKYPGVPLIDISKQQVIHEGLLTLRLSRRSFDVYMLLLNHYIIILTREGQDKYRLKFFTPEGKSGGPAASLSLGGGSSGSAGHSSSTSGAPISNLTPHQTVYSPVFVIDEHLTTRDAATDENGFYLLCKRKDDSRIYEFASRSPSERQKWREKIQWAIERQIGGQTGDRRPSCNSTLTKSSSEISANGLAGGDTSRAGDTKDCASTASAADKTDPRLGDEHQPEESPRTPTEVTATTTKQQRGASKSSSEPAKFVGTISYVIDDGIVMPSRMVSSEVLVDQAIQVNILHVDAKGTVVESSSA